MIIGKISIFGKNALPTISNEHNRAHGGELFTAGVSNAALGASASLFIEINIPASIEMHLKAYTFYNGDNGTIELLEAPTLTTGAAALTAFNKKRSSTRISSTILKSNPTGISSGVSLDKMSFKGTNQHPGILVISDWEWILKPSTVYLVSLTNDGVGNEQAYLRILFYEAEAAE